MFSRFSNNLELYKMSAFSQKGFLRLLVFLLFITASTQQLVLQLSNSANCGCSDGSVIGGKHQVVTVGVVITHGTGPPIFDFFKKRVNGAVFYADCVINVDADGCSGQLDRPCYCRENYGNNYTVVYNRTANELDSRATLALRYNGDMAYQELPVVRGAEHVTVTIARGGSSIQFSNVCSQVFKYGNTYDFEICGENLEGAEFYVGTNANVGPWNAAINNCSSFSVTLGTMTPLTFAYRETHACLRYGSTSCTLTGSKSEPACDDTCLISIVVVVVVVVIGGTIVVLILFWKKRLVCWEKTK